MHYVRAGRGDLPVVAVHGLGVSHRYFRPTLEELARDVEVWAPDFPGFGRSERPRRVLGVGELAGLLLAWMDAVGMARAVLLGNSMGCQTAVEAAVRAPERVAALVLAGPTADDEARSFFAQLGRLVRDSLREPLSLNAVVALDYLSAGPRRTVQTARLALRHAIEERARLVVAPTLVLRGERDPIAPQAWVERLAARFPAGRTAIVPGAAHAAHWSHPAAVADAVLGMVPGMVPGTPATPVSAR
jgi:2-hydroxy-6-oxonona-2,4-dienedioate hydrolase